MGFLDFIFGKHEENVKDKEASNDMPVNPAPEKNKSNMISNESNSGKTLPVEVEISKKKISPFRITLSFTPLRLSAYKKNPVTLIVKITNNLDKEQLVSVDALLPSNSMLGFDGIGVNKINETKVGKIMPGEKKEARIETLSRRAVFHTVNWLHYNPNDYWKWFSDIFAVALIILAISGMFILRGKNGLKWRGTILITTGILLPLIYLIIFYF